MFHDAYPSGFRFQWFSVKITVLTSSLAGRPPPLAGLERIIEVNHSCGVPESLVA